MSDTAELLREVPLFASISDDDLIALAAITERRGYPAGETIVREGEPGDELHVIADGHARVLVSGRPRRDLVRGAAFGEIALLDGGLRSATVYAVDDVETVSLAGDPFAALRRDRPALDHALLIGLCERLRGLEDDRWAAEEEGHLRTMQSTFLANASHELRTPLAVALGNVELAERVATAAPDRLATVLEASLTALTDLRRLVDDLIDLTELERRGAELDVELYPLDGLVEAALSLTGIAPERVTVRIPEGLTLEVDGRRVTRALAAVLDNAARFGPPDGMIAVTATADDLVHVDVADGGEGIDAETREAIFDPFTQRDPSATRRHGGLGIGLPLARSFVRLHGGNLTLVEHAPTTTFRLSLPDRPQTRG